MINYYCGGTMIRNLISIIIILLGFYYIYDHNLFNVQEFIRDLRKEVIVPEDNQYKKELDIAYVQNTDQFIPKDKQALLNIYYTAINSGWDKLTFYCDESYKKCIKDVKTISQDNLLLSHLNSFVHPYNSYSNIYTTYYEDGKVSIEITRTYDEYMINKIDKKIEEIVEKQISSDNTIEENIRNIHDYIINNTKYDVLKTKNIYDTTYKSNTTYGVLFENYAICSGYADTMALFLEKMNIPNIKIATNKHVWNLVYIDDNWYHLDLTWDDSVTKDNEQMLSHTFFLITSDQLRDIGTEDHHYNIDIYAEAQ